MNAQNLIQAFSRTNRIYDVGKKWCQIVTFQYPDQYSEAIDKALMLYANGGTNGVLAPDWNMSRKRYLQSRKKLEKYINNPEFLNTLMEQPKKVKREFVKAFQEYDHALAAIKTYDELDKQDQLPTSEQININDISTEMAITLEGIYNNIIDQLKADNKNDNETAGLDLDEDYEIESIHYKEVNEHYIMALIQDYISAANDTRQQVDVSQKSKNHDQTNQVGDYQVGDYIDQYSHTNKPRADHIRSIWQDVQRDPKKYSDRKVEDVLENSIQQENKETLIKFADYFGLNYDNLQYVIDNYEQDTANPKGMGKLVDKKSYNRFKKAHPNTEFNNLLKWRTEVREQLKTAYNAKIKPLTTED